MSVLIGLSSLFAEFSATFPNTNSNSLFTMFRTTFKTQSLIRKKWVTNKEKENNQILFLVQINQPNFFFAVALRPNAGHGLLIHEVSRSHTTVGRTPLDEWSARRRDLCLTTHNTHNRQTSMPPVGFEPTTSAGERPHTYTLNRAATRTG